MTHENKVKRDNFLTDLQVLCREHNVQMWGCQNEDPSTDVKYDCITIETTDNEHLCDVNEITPDSISLYE
jgi:hypothetical protein